MLINILEKAEVLNNLWNENFSFPQKNILEGLDGAGGNVLALSCTI
jgi:hypothetical protein